VVHHHIHDDADIALLRLRDQAVEVSQRAVLRVDVLVIGDVVPEIDLRRRIDRRKPDRIDAEPGEIVEALRDSI
jgi:hypothetical protein